LAGFLRTLSLLKLKLLLVRYCWLLVIFGVLVIILSFTNFAPELADTATNALSDISYASRAEQDDDYGENDQQFGSAKTLEYKHHHVTP